jgi:hypothetical protein
MMMTGMRRIRRTRARVMAIGRGFSLLSLVRRRFDVRMRMSIDRFGKVHPAPQH